MHASIYCNKIHIISAIIIEGVISAWYEHTHTHRRRKKNDDVQQTNFHRWQHKKIGKSFCFAWQTNEFKATCMPNHLANVRFWVKLVKINEPPFIRKVCHLIAPRPFVCVCVCVCFVLFFILAVSLARFCLLLLLTYLMMAFVELAILSHFVLNRFRCTCEKFHTHTNQHYGRTQKRGIRYE